MTSSSRMKRSSTTMTVNQECNCEISSEFTQLYVQGKESHARYIFGSLLFSFNLIGIKTNETTGGCGLWMSFINQLLNITVICVIFNEIFVFIYSIVPSILRHLISTLFVVSSVYCHRQLNRSVSSILDSLDKYSCLVVADKKGNKFLRNWCLALTSVGWLFFFGHIFVCSILLQKYGFRAIGNICFLGVSGNGSSRWSNYIVSMGIIVFALTVLMPLYFYVAFFIMITWFLSCLFSNHCRLTLRTIKIKPPTHKEHVHQSCTLYSHISELAKALNETYSYPALLWILVSSLLILLMLHSFIVVPTEEDVTVDCTLFLLPGLVALFTFIVQCLAGDALITDGRSLIPALSAYADRNADRYRGIYSLSEMLIDKVRVGAPSFSVAKLIKVDRNLIFILVNGIVTYMAIIIHIFK